MPKLSENKTLTTELLASLFMQLSRLEESGIPAVESLRLLETTDEGVNKRIAKMQRLLSSGSSIADAGFNVGIFNKTHRALISAAESCGRVTAVYKQLTKYYEDRLLRLKKIKSRLYLPVLILLLALLIKPIALLVNSEISLLDYLSLSLGRFLLIAALFFLAFKLTSWFKAIYHRLQLSLPKVKGWVIRRQINEFLMILAIMLQGGLAFAEALPLAVASIKNTMLRKRFDAAIKISHTGESVTTILSKVDVIPAMALQIIRTGEESGKLADALLHFTNHEAEMIFIDDDSLAEWLPRFFYIGVALWMAASILGY
ncbi:MAG: hypothetical protein GQ569_13255 [Methylococcaceae bacterium]|nr:hypothetical protein [Methylococcaceae bacterium]